ncbi:GNAT family N-acetyltransferase [Brevibacillus dissolubilis]|uniref:GNAT family N-acetyltransferase n=1 Tax=Brevibacillus dissolubilis TaxID=1844116 RepID=UPI0011175418|nr:GNAT family N-acetyltransferase [Brevibacillus dissolubilis]
MRGIVSNATKEEITAACIANRAEYVLSFGTGIGSAYYSGEDVKWVYTGLNYLNCVFAVHLSGEGMEQRVEEIMSFYDQRHVCPTWLVNPQDEAGIERMKLEKKLESLGFTQVFEFPAMAVDLKEWERLGWLDHKGEGSTMSSFDPISPAFSLVQVNSAIGLEHWCQLTCAGFHVQKHQLSEYMTLLHSSVEHARFPTHVYIGYWNDKPVCAVSVLEAAGVAGIYWVSTVPQARGRGFATMMMRQLLSRVHAMGYQYATLQSTEMGYSLYRGLGFFDLYRESGYERTGCCR